MSINAEGVLVASLYHSLMNMQRFSFQVKIAALNDSKLIAMSVYNVTIMSVVGLGISFVIRGDPSALFTFTSCVVIFCTTITLLIVFMPKV